MSWFMAPVGRSPPPQRDCRLLPLDLLDRVGLGATRSVDLDVLALLLVDQRTRNRRGDRNASLLGVRLGLADDLPDLLLIGVLVDECDGRTEGDRVTRQLRNVNHVGARELVLELGDTALVERLRFLRGMIFGVLRQIAVRARVGDLLDDAGPLNLLAVLELGFERRITGGRHRNLFHRLFSSWRTPEQSLANSAAKRLSLSKFRTIDS